MNPKYLETHTSVNFPKDGKILSKVNLSELNNYDYFIASKNFYVRYFLQRDIYPEKTDKYRYIFNSFLKIIEFKPKIIDINKDDINFWGDFRLWFNPHQISGPSIAVYDLRQSITRQKLQLDH